MFERVKRAFGTAMTSHSLSLKDSDGDWYSPCDVRYAFMAYSIAMSVTVPDWYGKAIRGKNVTITIRNGMSEHPNKYGLCCKIGDGAAKILAAVSRDEGNSDSANFLLGKMAEKNYADVVCGDCRGVDRAYRKLVYDVFGINPDAKDFYDQLLRKHFEITGAKYSRTIDDENGLYDNVKAGGNSQQRNSGQSNPKRQSNAQSTGSQSEGIKRLIDQYRVDDRGSVDMNGAFAYYPQDLSAVVANAYDYCEKEFEDGKGAAMEITKLIGRACLNAIRRCLGVVKEKRHSDRDCLCFLFQMLDLKNIDQALALLYPKNGKQQNGQNEQDQKGNGNKKGNKPEGTGPQTGGDPQSKAGQKPAEPAPQQPQPKPQADPAIDPDDNDLGFGDEPLKDMTEGKPIRFGVIEKVIGLAEQSSKDANIPLVDKGRLILAALALRQAITERKQDDSTADAIGAVYLNNLLREIEAYGISLGGKKLKFNET